MNADLRQALRLLVKNSAFTSIAVLTLALGIGANTAIFTIANAVLLRSLPFSDPDRLVLVSGTLPSERDEAGRLSFPFFKVLHDRNHSFSGVAACTFETFSVTGHGDPEQIYAARTSWNFFDVLGVKPIAGRTFSQEEDQRGGPQVVMISYELWNRLLGGDRNAVGSSLALEGRAYTVIGILPPHFGISLLGSKVDIWAPRVPEMSLVTPARVAAGGTYFYVIGRLAPGVTNQRAETESEMLYQQYKHEDPGRYDATLDLKMHVRNLQDELVSNVRPTILILAASVGLVLLIACANVASLLLSRALGRRKEFAIRTALGGSRVKLVRQLLTESVLIGLVAGIFGIALGVAGTRLLEAFGQEALPGTSEVSIDLRVLLFTLAVSVFAGILFGLAPSLQLSKPDLNIVLRDEGRGTAGNRKRNRGRAVLVVAQVALSSILLIGSGLLIRSFVRLRSVSPGFEPNNLLTMQVSLRKYTQAQSIAFSQDVIRRVEAVPGVAAVGISTALPPTATHATPILFEGQPTVPLGKRPIINLQQTSPDYPKALGVPLLAGRSFTDHDDASAPKVAMINRAAAKRFFGDQNPVGKRVWVGNLPAAAEIVGVLGDTRNSSLALPAVPEVFLPFPQLPWSFFCLSVRTSVEPHGLVSAVRREIAAADRDQPVIEIHTGDELLEASAGQTRFMMFLLGVFSATAFILVAIGIYGVIAYSVAQRTNELGIRIALGATRADILKLVIGSGLLLTGTGIVIGLAGSVAATRLLESLLYETSATDPLTFFVSAILFTVVAAVASYFPARRATRIDPSDALRAE
jgi:putative ABC transport system permease protein